MDKLFDLPINFKVKSISEEENEDSFITIEGYANTTTVDRVGDIILEEAWTKGGLDNYLKNPIILAYHNHSKPIGTMIDYAVNNKGFKIVATISKAAGEVYSLIKEGVLKTFSVGFRTRDAEYDSTTELFVIKDLELFEVSVVSVPANADSTFSIKKSFQNEDEYNSFKLEHLKDAGTVNADKALDKDSENIEENKMGDTVTKAQLEAEMRAKIEKELKEEQDRQAELAKTVSQEVEKATAGTTEVVEERVKGLKEEIEKRLSDETTSMTEAMESIKSEIAEYAEQLKNFNKMTFTDKEKTGEQLFTDRERDEAILVSKMIQRPVEETKYFQNLITKSDAAHQTGMTQDWEAGFSSRLFNDIREKLIIEPLFTSFAMPNVTMNLPLNPEAGYGTWVTTAQLGAATSSGTGRTHGVTDTSITAHKLATKELLTYEEEDDAMIAMVPLIRDASIRRMAKSSDKALLIGDAATLAGTGEGNYPFNGLATIGVDSSRTVTIGGTLASPTKVTIADLQGMRRQMGVHGHNPSDVVYVVNHDVYYDLLDDPDFRTMDLVGSQATILTGQVGRVAGSPVIVSGEFPAAAASNAAAVCVNMANYIKGEYKGLVVERERSVENQTNLLVVTRRFGMLELFPTNATVVTLVNPAT